MELTFQGKRALVTGAGKGIGRLTAKALVQCGAEVIALTRTQADLDTLVEEVPSIKPLCIDLNNIDEAVKAIEQQGDIHLLVNNAGIMNKAPFLEVTQHEFDQLYNVNVKAPLFVAQEVARKMIAGGHGGAIVNVSSRASHKAFRNSTLYCSTKTALDMLTKVMALELGPNQIRVNSVNPCIVIGTNMTDENFRVTPPEVIQRIKDGIPLKEFPDNQDVVNAILYLLSDKAAMINGVNLLIDGGDSVK